MLFRYGHADKIFVIQRESIQLIAIYYPFLPLYDTLDIAVDTIDNARKWVMFQKQDRTHCLSHIQKQSILYHWSDCV